MAQTLKIKRGNNENLGSLTLATGEPAFVLDTGKLYLGNGTDKVLINPDIPTKSETTDKLNTARTISLSGDITGSVSFDGSGDVTIKTTEKASGVIAGTYTKVTVDEKGNVTNGGNIAPEDVPVLTLSKISDVGTAASKNTGTASGNVPILDASGKLDTSILPAITVTDTFVIGIEKEMLELNAQVGDVAVRTDLSKSFILKTADASVIDHWQELLTPVDSVTSVAGKTGVVILNSADVGLGNVTNESKQTMFTNPTFTGIPVAPTADPQTNTTQIATTEFVINAVGNKTSISGNAGTATKLEKPVNVSVTGDATGTTIFDGSADAAIDLKLSNSGVTAGTYKSVTVDAKGRVTAGTNPTTLGGYGITDAVNASDVVTKAAPNKILKLDANSKLPASITGNADGNAGSATKLETAKTISLTGDVSGVVSFDGSADVSIAAAIKNIDGGTF